MFAQRPNKHEGKSQRPRQKLRAAYQDAERRQKPREIQTCFELLRALDPHTLGVLVCRRICQPHRAIRQTVSENRQRAGIYRPDQPDGCGLVADLQGT
jgi:hypothetical protein